MQFAGDLQNRGGPLPFAQGRTAVPSLPPAVAWAMIAESEHFCELHVYSTGSPDSRNVSPGSIPPRTAGPPTDTLS